MLSESTRVARSSQRITAVKIRESILGEPPLTPLKPLPFEPDEDAAERFVVDCVWLLAVGADAMVHR